MILQRDGRCIADINEFGCYYMDLLFGANKYENIQLGFPFINDFYVKERDKGYISKLNFIQHPEHILYDLGLLVVYHGKLPSTYICKPDEFEINHWVRIDDEKQKHHHFVFGDGKGRTAYDPWGVSKTVTDGDLYNKRVFEIL